MAQGEAVTDVEFTSPGWWVASRTGGAVEAVLGIDLDVRRVPRLLVPVDVQALVVTGASATGDRADVRSRMLDESPTSGCRPRSRRSATSPRVCTSIGRSPTV